MEQTNRPAMYDVVRAVAKAANISVEEMTGETQFRDHVTYRWAAMLLGRRLGYATPNIGRRLGNRDHTTVMSGLRSAMREIQRGTGRGAQLVRIIDGAVERLRLEPIDWGLPKEAFEKPAPEPSKRLRRHCREVKAAKQATSPLHQHGEINKHGEIILTP